MSYQSGFLHQRVTIRNKVVAAGFGDTTGYQDAATVWANISFSKGMKALHEGALDAYDTVIIRMRWNNIISRDSHIVYDGKEYQIQSFHRNFEENIVQITAVEIVQAAPAYTPSASAISGGSRNRSEFGG
jgi:SPP1 family predicted phage head-tail adaptor